MKRCEIFANNANIGGGTMNLGRLEIDDCVVRKNTAEDHGITGAGAGGIASSSIFSSFPSATAIIRNSAIVDNVGLLTLSRSRIRQSSDSPHAL